MRPIRPRNTTQPRPPIFVIADRSYGGNSQERLCDSPDSSAQSLRLTSLSRGGSSFVEAERLQGRYSRHRSIKVPTNRVDSSSIVYSDKWQVTEVVEWSDLNRSLHSLIMSPCAACKILRRRCVDSCVLAPYFPPTDPLKFTIAHRVFGASNIIKLLQELPEPQRADAVSSMVYEANARLRDPVYGCAGTICQLQKQINELQAELAKAQAEILNFQCQNATLLELIFSDKNHHVITENRQIQELSPQEPIFAPYIENSTLFLDESVLGVAWEPLWT
ncbi:LOB domain-containing protein [Striga asiatica]|uniref:LOB domain-containing protein n=1 Tax=Striga asiatica TaxID=4170 RepID=A0A5A7R3I1_STRAF|nr:LOB domain-containing protein [Striga asiatica]